MDEEAACAAAFPELFSESVSRISCVLLPTPAQNESDRQVEYRSSKGVSCVAGEDMKF